MNKTRILVFAVIALFILNFGLLAFLFLSKNNNEKKARRMPREIIIEQLHFDKHQIEKYDVTIKKHQKSIRKIDDSIKNTKNQLYKLLNNSTIDTKKRDSLYVVISNYQKQIETIHFEHFLEIKEFCNEKQQENFEQLTEQLSKIFSHPRKPKND